MSGIITPELSKQVGWDPPASIQYPTMEQVNNCTSEYQLLKWHRFLPSPSDENQVEIINRIYARVIEGKE